MRRWLSRSSIPLGMAWVCAATAGCTTKAGEDPMVDEGCVSTETFFKDEVWAPVLSTNCIQCHNAQGAAKDTEFVLQSAAQTGFLAANLDTVGKVARFEVGGTSVLLLKPLGELEHGGGVRLSADSAEYMALQSLVAQLEAPIACADETSDDLFANLQYLDNAQLLRKLNLNLVGRLPTEAELAAVQQDGLPGVELALDGMMREEAFYARLKEAYNDIFLTDRYYSSDSAIGLLDANDYPNRQWYDAEPDDTLRRSLLSLSNQAVARGPLELVAHVVRTERPFSEILTADYVMLNPFSARVYDVSGMGYMDGDDPANYDAAQFQPGQIPGIPHAGVMTSHVFLNRFPTTATNVNRHRSRMIYKMFLATDILKLAERPVDATQIEDHNPTLYNAACTVCHAVMDPIAGTFQNWDTRGRYRPPEMGWNSDMLPPGFNDQHVPAGEGPRSLQWLAEQIADDDRFATSVVHTVFTMLTGQEPVSGTTDGLTAEQAKAKLAAFDAQEKVFSQARQTFKSNSQSFKAVVKAIALSPFFRAANARAPSAETAQALAWTGTGRLLTPEQLDRKIEAVTGRPWVRSDRRVLLSTRDFLIFYGGIDSDSVTSRITAPNGVMANIAKRMANEMSCLAVPFDFLNQDAAQRRLFPLVERSYVPEDENGFEIPAAVEAIRANITHLHQRLLGESPGREEVDATYNLFLETWREGQAAVQAEEVSSYLQYTCRAERDPATGETLPEELRVARDQQFTVRAWMAVVTYLMSDWAFLYE